MQSPNRIEFLTAAMEDPRLVLTGSCGGTRIRVESSQRHCCSVLTRRGGVTNGRDWLVQIADSAANLAKFSREGKRRCQSEQIVQSARLPFDVLNLHDNPLDEIVLQLWSRLPRPGNVLNPTARTPLASLNLRLRSPGH